MAHRAYKYRLWPTPEQAAWLEQSFAAIRWVYNAALEQRKTYGRAKGTDPHGRNSAFTAPRQAKELNFRSLEGRPGLLDDPDLSWITQAPRDCIDAALRDLDKAFDGFFKGRGGFPSWRSKDRNNSLSFRAWSRKRVDGETISRPIVLFGRNCVTLPKIGRIKYTRHRKFYGDPKTVEVARDGQEYYVVLVTEHVFAEKPHKGGAVGIDLGVARPVSLSNGEFIEPDAMLEELEAKARKEARSLSRKKKGSNRREKQKRHLAAIRRKQARRRAGRTHDITTNLVRRFATIAMEDLRVSNMTASAKGTAEEPGRNVKAKSGLNRAILNVTPYQFRQQLEYKAEKTGSEIIAVDPRNTSRTCFICGHVSADNRRSQSLFVCTNCGHEANADINAACNILMRAKPSAGASARRKTPSEIQWNSATSKGNVSCFQPPSVLNSVSAAEACP